MVFSDSVSTLVKKESIIPKKYRASKHLTPKVETEFRDGLMNAGDTVRNRWRIKAVLGSGGYGQIYLALDEITNETVAVKVEPVKRRGKTARRMILEQKILLKLQGSPHVPMIWGSGTENNINYIVMQLLSRNIADLRKQSPLRRLSRSTCGRIIIQAIAGLRDIHNVGYLHRDVKPSNMCFGLTSKSRYRLIILDYGLVRKFRTEDGRLVPKRERAGFRGTMRYVSMRVHDRKEQGPSDDIIATFFVLLELLNGELPWRNLETDVELKASKESMVKDDFEKVCQNGGECVREFGRLVMKLSADDTPDYRALQLIMKKMAKNRHLDAPYDWDKDYMDVVKEALFV